MIHVFPSQPVGRRDSPALQVLREALTGRQGCREGDGSQRIGPLETVIFPWLCFITSSLENGAQIGKEMVSCH